jgi:hypothetical protein
MICKYGGRMRDARSTNSHHQTPLQGVCSHLTAFLLACCALCCCCCCCCPSLQSYDYQRLFDSMVKPAFIFDGRNVLDHEALRSIGFIVYALGKPLGEWVWLNPAVCISLQTSHMHKPADVTCYTVWLDL